MSITRYRADDTGNYIDAAVLLARDLEQAEKDKRDLAAASDEINFLTRQNNQFIDQLEAARAEVAQLRLHLARIADGHIQDAALYANAVLKGE